MKNKVVVELITIGDELLIGQVVNTNASWLGNELQKNGFFLKHVETIGDDESEILDAFENASKRAHIVLITGGLGPTDDDLTKAALCRYFNTKTTLNQEALEVIRTLFEKRGMELTPRNYEQAMLPELCNYIPNAVGTAPGMWFEGNDVIYVSMPGVPFEMQNMVTNEILPRLKQRFETIHYAKRTVLVTGIGESFLADKIQSWEKSLPNFLSLAYLPQYGIVRLRLSGWHADMDFLNETIEKEINTLMPHIMPYFFGTEEDKLEEIVLKLLKERKQTLATAESCTGGNIAHLITGIAGSSTVFNGSVVAYANSAKENLLGVDAKLIEKHGAVSQEVVESMARNACRVLKTDFAVATSGIAGPDGGTLEKPVGTVWIAVATPKETFSQRYNFGNTRENTIKRASITALNMLRKWLLEN
ncbi:MAG: competence/damage-inducible protein A [Lentimicrobiaceae bacterium]|jgi:nicotinamide-nucleotide amidase|nr:competence/damage-inducible protein A [Lentimicrobiaceae bacterium]